MDPDGQSPVHLIVGVGYLLIYLFTPEGTTKRIVNNFEKSITVKPTDSKDVVAGKTLIKAAGLKVSGGTSGAVAEAKGTTRAGVVAKDIIIDYKSDWANTSGILRSITKQKGNFGIGKATTNEANALGRSWVGDGYRIASDGKTLVSKDGLRTYRPPSLKPNSPYAITGKQANLEQLEPVKINNVWKKRVIRNAHIDITD